MWCVNKFDWSPWLNEVVSEIGIALSLRFSDDLGVGMGCQVASCPREYDGGGWSCGCRCLTSSTNVRGWLDCVSGVALLAPGVRLVLFVGSKTCSPAFCEVLLIRCLGSLLDDELDASVAAKLLALFCLASASALAERASVRFNSIGTSYRLYSAQLYRWTVGFISNVFGIIVRGQLVYLSEALTLPRGGLQMKYLLRDGLEIGMSAGTRSNPQCFSLQYLINLILLLVRGESVAD